MPVISDLSLTVTPYTALYETNIDAQAQAFESTDQGRNAIVLDFNQGAGVYSRDIELEISWPTRITTILYLWQPSLIDQPENIYNRATDWSDCGFKGAKYIQGVILEANSFNANKTFYIQDSDTLALNPLNETPAAFNLQNRIAFSCVTPFVAHNVRIIAQDGVAWQIFDAEYVCQPWPETAKNWQTEKVSFGLTGWGHIREFNIPHISTADLTLTLSFDGVPSTITLTIPNSGGEQRKTKVTVPANKFKLASLRISSTAVFRLFEADVEVKAKQWGSTESYVVLKPFGGMSRPGAQV